MKSLLILCLFTGTTCALADPPEDAAHRADRQTTARLNERAAAVVARRDRGNAQALDSYDGARARYAHAMDEWRRRVAACQAGQWDACER